jgi:hypothetical protein
MRAALGPPSLKGAALTALDSALMAAATPSGTTTPKTINLIFAAASGSSPNSATPAYVTGTGWAGSSPPVDVCYCTNYEGNSDYSNLGPNCYNTMTYPPLHGGFDASGVPASWEFPFYNAYYQFAQKLAGYYSGLSSISSYIGYIRFGLLTGGGTVVACPAVEEGIFPYGSMPTQTGIPAVPLTEPILEQYATNMFSSIQAQKPAMILDSSMFGGESFGTNGVVPIQWADDIARIAIANGFGITAESLQSADLTDYAAALPCSNDWCSLFNYYYSIAPMQGLQTISQSNPNCLNQPSTCGGGNLTGSLVTVLPFATQRRDTVLEVYYQDLLCAYDQDNYYDSDCPELSVGPPPIYLAPYMPYQTSLTNAVAGRPNSTGNVTGSSALSGAADIQ